MDFDVATLTSRCLRFTLGRGRNRPTTWCSSEGRVGGTAGSIAIHPSCGWFRSAWPKFGLRRRAAALACDGSRSNTEVRNVFVVLEQSRSVVDTEFHRRTSGEP